MSDLKQPPKGAFDYLLYGPPLVEEPPRRRPPRLVINIELPAPKPPARFPGRARWWFLRAAVVWMVVWMLAAIAHGEPLHYDHWQSTDGWHGETRTEGNTTTWTDYGPRGQQHTCHRYQSGQDVHTSCH